jgi:glyoxylase-like metal-dependent hydrolase (beta-lactamase superfamily II)
VDLPNSDPAAMTRSLRRLVALTDPLQVYPGHDYGGLTASLRAIAESDPPLLPFL